MSVHPPLDRVQDTLYALQVPIPFPMKTVTVLIDVAPPVTLVDCALDTPEARQAIEDALAALGLHWPDIGRVIVTHHHPDHYGLAGLIEERSGAQILMLDLDITRGERYWHDWEAWLPGHNKHLIENGLPPESLLGAEAESRRSRGRVRPASRVTPLREGDTVRLAHRNWQVLWLPGHADGHLGLYDPVSRDLIAGDAILPRISPNIGLYAYSRPDPLGDYLGTLAKLEALNPARSIVGHYGPYLPETAGRARELAAHHAERLNFCRAELAAQPLDGYALSLRMFTRDLDVTGRRFALAETLAHAEHLRARGEVLREWTGEVWQYRA